MPVFITAAARFSVLSFLTLMMSAAFAQIETGQMPSKSEAVERPQCPAAFVQSLKKLHSKETLDVCSLYQSSKAFLVVNTASNCGFTGQFADLEALYQRYGKQGLVILGIPSHDFKQEEKAEADTARVCFTNYGVTFPMAAPLPVKGDKAHPLFVYLTSQSQGPKWNFTKYLVDSAGQVTQFGSMTPPLNSRLEDAIKALLGPTE